MGRSHSQYAYGDGAEESCRLTSEKVSELDVWRECGFLFFTDVEGLVAATDAVEELLLPCQKIIQLLILHLKKVQKLLLMGNLLKNMSVKRDIEVLDSNNQRMERQSQFMDALIEKMQSIQSKTEYLSLYQKLGDYMTTNMTADEMEELTDYKIAEDTVKVPGEIIEKDGHAQYLVDNKELKKIILKMFYKIM
ncbi:MAG: hypothetical protein ACLR2O_08190 [Coprococcus sp.]